MAYIIPQRAVGVATQRCFMLILCCCHTIQAGLHKAEIWPSFALWQKRQRKKSCCQAFCGDHCCWTNLTLPILRHPDGSGTQAITPTRGKWISLECQCKNNKQTFCYLYFTSVTSRYFPVFWSFLGIVIVGISCYFSDYLWPEAEKLTLHVRSGPLLSVPVQVSRCHSKRLSWSSCMFIQRRCSCLRNHWSIIWLKDTSWMKENVEEERSSTIGAEEVDLPPGWYPCY